MQDLCIENHKNIPFSGCYRNYRKHLPKEKFILYYFTMSIRTLPREFHLSSYFSLYYCMRSCNSYRNSEKKNYIGFYISPMLYYFLGFSFFPVNLNLHVLPIPCSQKQNLAFCRKEMWRQILSICFP